MKRVHSIVLYRGIDTESYKMEFLVKEAVERLSQELLIRLEFTRVLLPQMKDVEPELKVDDVLVSLRDVAHPEELEDRIVDALLNPLDLNPSPTLSLLNPPAPASAGGNPGLIA